MNRLYLVRYGDKVKVGITYDLVSRYRTYRSAARRDGLEFAPLLELPLHPEASANERAVLDRFGSRGSRSEYLDADSNEVIRFIQTLPCTSIPDRERIRESEQWLDRADVARMLGVSTVTLARYSRTGQLPPYKNSITNRVRFRVEDVRAFAELTR